MFRKTPVHHEAYGRKFKTESAANEWCTLHGRFPIVFEIHTASDGQEFMGEELIQRHESWLDEGDRRETVISWYHEDYVERFRSRRRASTWAHKRGLVLHSHHCSAAVKYPANGFVSGLLREKGTDGVWRTIPFRD
jgi:hypothetical protein